MEEIWKGHVAWWDGGVLREASFGPSVQSVEGGFGIQGEVEAKPGGLRLAVYLSVSPARALHALHIELPVAVGSDDRIFLNGYQSWTESRLYRPDERIKPLRGPLPHLVNTTGDYTLFKQPAEPGRLHAWSFTALQRAGGGTQFWMDAAPATGYTRFEWDCAAGRLRIVKDVGGLRAEGDFLLLEVDCWEEAGTEVSAPRLPGHTPRPVKAPATGWTSWYNYYTKIDQSIILDNLRAFAFREVPIDFFQIDDGWQPAVGDWLEANAKFPLGMAHIADQVHRYGYKAGLWLAPLIVEKGSQVYRAHRDWLLTHDGERLVDAGYNPGWGGLLNGTYHVLDIDLPEVRMHLRAVFDRILGEWGFDLVKLDFLFAAGLVPHGGKSRGQRMHEAFAFLRECCGDKLILGCGVPLAAAWGQADYCRIGPDIGLGWDLDIARRIHLRERISTHNACLNTIHRRHFSGRLFANDPDVFILRKANNDLTPQQKHTLLVLNHIFGDLLFTSDHIGSYDGATMRLYRSTFPLPPRHVTRVEQDGERHDIWFEVGERRYFAVANLGRLDLKVKLPDGKHYRNGEGFVEDPGAVYLKPYETRVYLQWPDSEVGIAGSDLHIFPGCEVASLQAGGEGIVVTLAKEATLSGTLVLKVGGGGQVSVNGRLMPVHNHLVILDVVDGKLW